MSNLSPPQKKCIFDIMKRLPLGKQHFELFFREDLLYVDKTPIIYKLIDGVGYYFLSRPRRFGKSLLVDTLKNIFLGKQELFKGLWIYDKIDWKVHPVIHLDFSVLEYEGLGLSVALMESLDKIANSYSLQLTKETSKGKLSELIEVLSEKAPVAILIDEYDKPITDYITDLAKANENRETLREFYGALKALGDKIQLLFITGIAKFSRVSLFSVLNHLTDISLNEEFATICGITHEELVANFEPYLERAEKKLKLPREAVLEQIKKMYNGYSWDGENFVYNPFSLLNFLNEQRFRSYWFKTGTPSFLIELLRQKKIDAKQVESLQVEDTFFDSFNIEWGIAIEPLLFQTGYWTIKKIEYDNYFPIYTLTYPNLEVRRAFLHNLLEIYTYKPETTINSVTLKIRKALNSKDIEALEDQLNILFSDISSHLFPFEKKAPDEERVTKEFLAWEGYFQTIIYIVLQYIGIYIKCEVSKHKGRLDAVVEVPNYIYIMEFKLEDAEAALQQIKDQQYHHSYQNSSKEILLLGIAFDQKNRMIKKIEQEVWDKKLNLG